MNTIYTEMFNQYTFWERCHKLSLNRFVGNIQKTVKRKSVQTERSCPLLTTKQSKTKSKDLMESPKNKTLFVQTVYLYHKERPRYKSERMTGKYCINIRLESQGEDITSSDIQVYSKLRRKGLSFNLYRTTHATEYGH